MHVAARKCTIENILPLTFTGLSLEESEEKVRQLVKEKYLTVVRDAHERLLAAKTDPSRLRQGFWNPIDYCRLATELGYDITALKEDGAFCHGLPPAGFEHLSNESSTQFDFLKEMPNSPLSNKKVATYQIKNNYTPTVALKSIWESLSFIDCQEAIEIAYYEVLLEIFGEDNFNQMFKGNIILCPEIEYTPLEFFLELTDVNSFEEMLEGDQVYIKNSGFYPYRHLIGTDGGHHCTCIQKGPDSKVATFGHSPDGYTQEQMFQLEADTFNLEPIAFDQALSPELAKKYEDLMDTQEIRIKRENANAKIPLTAEDIKEPPHEAGLDARCWRLSVFKIQMAFSELSDGN